MSQSIVELAIARRDSGHTVFVCDLLMKAKIVHVNSSVNDQLSDLIESVEQQGWTLDQVARQGQGITAIFRRDHRK